MQAPLHQSVASLHILRPAGYRRASRITYRRKRKERKKEKISTGLMRMCVFFFVAWTFSIGISERLVCPRSLLPLCPCLSSPEDIPRLAVPRSFGKRLYCWPSSGAFAGLFRFSFYTQVSNWLTKYCECGSLDVVYTKIPQQNRKLVQGSSIPKASVLENIPDR